MSSFTLRWLSKKCTLWRERAPIIVRSVKSQPSLGLAAGAFFLLAVVGVGDLGTNPCMLPGVHSKFRRAPNAQAIFCRRRHQPRRPPIWTSSGRATRSRMPWRFRHMDRLQMPNTINATNPMPTNSTTSATESYSSQCRLPESIGASPPL